MNTPQEHHHHHHHHHLVIKSKSEDNDDINNPLIDEIRKSVIGDNQPFIGPFGLMRVTYCDYTAR